MDVCRYPFKDGDLFIYTDGTLKFEGQRLQFESSVARIEQVNGTIPDLRRPGVLELSFGGKSSEKLSLQYARVSNAAEKDLFEGLLRYLDIVTGLAEEEREFDIEDVPLYMVDTFYRIKHDGTDLMRADSAKTMSIYPDRISFQDRMKVLDEIKFSEIREVSGTGEQRVPGEVTTEEQIFADANRNDTPFPKDDRGLFRYAAGELAAARREKRDPFFRICYERDGELYMMRIFMPFQRTYEEAYQAMERDMNPSWNTTAEI